MKEKKRTMPPIARRAVTVALCINLLSGAQYAWSMLGASLMEARGWTITQTTLPYSILFVVASLWSIVVGSVGDRIGPVFFIRLGAVCNAVGLTIAGNTENWWLVLLAVGLSMGIASASLANSTSPTALRYVPVRYKGVVSGVVSAGIGWTSFYVAPLIRGLLSVTGVSETFAVIGIVDGILLFILSFFLPNPVKDPSPKEEEEETGQSVSEAYKVSAPLDGSIRTTGEALRSREVWYLFFIFCCASVAGLMFTSQVTTIARVQAGVEDGTILVMTMGVVNGFGRLLTPSLSDRVGVFRIWLLVFLVMIADMAVLSISHTLTALFPALCVMSFFAGGANPLMWATVSGIFGTKYMGTVFGVVTNGFAVASITSPVIAAGIAQTTGSYTAAFGFVAGISFCGLLLTARLTKRITRGIRP